MSGTEVERFFSTSQSLSSRDNLPTRQAKRQENFSASNISKIVLGRMLAQVAIVPMPGIDYIALLGYGGDREMLAAVHGRIEGTTLKLEGEIPFKPGSSSGSFGGGGVFIGGNVTIVGSSYSSVSSSGGSGGDTIILNNREVDLDRAIQFTLMVPSTLNVKVSGLIGAIGITDYLDAELDFSPSIRAELVADGVKSLIGDLKGSGKASLTSVMESADLEVSGSGNITISRGASRKFRGSVSGSGNVSHYGTVRGDARLRVSGSGSAIATRVEGEVDRSVTGSGRVTVNGKTYRPRHDW